MTRRPRIWPRRGAGTAPGVPAPCDSAGTGAVESQALPPLLLTDPLAPAAAEGMQRHRPAGDAPAEDETIPYLAHFGLSMAPFSLLPDPGFLFWSISHKRAHAILEYGLMSRAPLSMVTGEIGAGKTTLVHQLLRGQGAGLRMALISNSSELRGELLYWVLLALGERPAAGSDPAALFEAFQTSLIETYAGGRRVVLIFDEAQTLGRDRLEQLRMLTNINTGSDVLLQVVLVGQPELRALVCGPDMVQFRQRVAASFHLSAMTAETEAAYVRHRLQVAGATRPVFEPSALERIHAATGGVPRLTNQLCDLAMLYAYSAGKPVVDAGCVQHVIDDGVLLGACPAPRDEPAPRPGLTTARSA